MWNNLKRWVALRWYDVQLHTAERLCSRTIVRKIRVKSALYVVSHERDKMKASVEQAHVIVCDLSEELDQKGVELETVKQDVRALSELRVNERKELARRMGTNFRYTKEDVISWMKDPLEIRRINELRAVALEHKRLKYRVMAAHRVMDTLARKHANLDRHIADYEVSRDLESACKALEDANALDMNKLTEEILKDLSVIAERVRASEEKDFDTTLVDQAFEELAVVDTEADDVVDWIAGSMITTHKKKEECIEA